MPKPKNRSNSNPTSIVTRRSSRKTKSTTNYSLRLSRPPQHAQPKVLLSQFPSEILIEIFDFLSVTDLKNLALVCRHFNSTINNTKLSNKFLLNFDENFQNREWIGSRKYSQVTMEDEKGSFAILKSIGHDLKRLTVDIRSIDLKTIARILNLCPGLKFIKFEDVKTHSYLDDLGHRELPRHSNVEIWIENTTPNIFDLFKFMKISKLTIVGPTRESDFDSCYSTGDCRIAFGKFMKSQKILEDLTLMNFKPPATLFGDNSLDSVKFKLKKFKIQNFRLDNLNFFHFLDNHKDTIQKVEMDTRGLSLEFVRFLENSPNFTELVFTGNLLASRTFNTVTKLTANFNLARSNWQQYFPNLKELKIQSECRMGIPLGFFDHMKNLERLEIHSTHFPNMRFISIPTVKYLTLRHVTGDFPKFFEYQSSNLNELIIDDCNVVWLQFYLREIKERKLKLKKMSISNTRLSVDCKKIIDKCKGEVIQHLELINVNIEASDRFCC